MKSKLKYLTKQSFKKKVNTKWFKAVNIILLVLFLFLANIDRIISLFGGDFQEEETILLKDESNVTDLLETTLTTLFSTYQQDRNYKVLRSEEDIQTLKENLNDQEKNIIIHLFDDEKNYLQAEVISYEEISLTTKQMIVSALQSVKEEVALQRSPLSLEEKNALMMPISIQMVTLNDQNSEENKEIVGMIAAFLFILPCFFLILMLVQMVGAEINDEKTTRSMEIIISNVSPQVHFLSKIYASTLFVVVQALLVFLYAVISFGFRMLFSGGGSLSGDMLNQVQMVLHTAQETGIVNLLLQGLPFLIILFLSSFFLYAIVAGVFASMTTSLEDFQQLQTPMMLIIMIGYYLAIMATQMEGAIFIKAVSFLPMLSFLIAPVLFLIGQLSLWELAFSSLITVIFTFIIFHFGLRIYKVGILNYSSSKLWRKMFQSLKKK